MSIQCVGCGDTICAPEPAWYAGTGHSYTVAFLCGTCVSLIPNKDRVMIQDLHPFAVSFGHLIAPTGSYNRYQCIGSNQDRVIFCTNARTIKKTIPYANSLLDFLHPFYCIQEYLEEIMIEYKVASKTEPCAWHNLTQNIQKYGMAIADWLDVPHTAVIDRVEIRKKGAMSYLAQNHLSSGELKAVMKILIKRYGV